MLYAGLFDTDIVFTECGCDCVIQRTLDVMIILFITFSDDGQRNRSLSIGDDTVYFEEMT